MIIYCPHCSYFCQGGMTLVRHIVEQHNIDCIIANQEVDEIYRKISGTGLKMNWPSPAGYKTVPYEYLTAKECETLKESVIDKMDRGEEFMWGTTGEARDEELQKYSIKHLSTQHLENILITQPHVNNETAAAILMLLKKRYGAL